MRKRRIKFKARFLVILAVFVVLGIGVLVGIQTHGETTKTSESVGAIADMPKQKDYLLDIPLSHELQDELYEASEEFGVDYYVMVALIDRETNFQNVTGDNGNSFGYCQIQPKWWYGLMLEIGATNLSVPRDNFRAGCAIIAQLQEEYHSIEGALVAYSQGDYKGSSTPYSKEIIANAKRYKA